MRARAAATLATILVLSQGCADEAALQGDASLDALASDVPIDVDDVGDASDVVSPRDVPDVPRADVASDRVDVAVADVPVAPSTVAVSHTRELRAAWIATVSNIDFPSRRGLTAAQGRAEMLAILDAMARAGLNAAVLQVRCEGDAFYRSMLEPWSRYLTGTPGRDPGWDPLGTMVSEAHARGIEVHAWFNPYRASTAASNTQVSPHISITHPEAVVTYDGKRWMNPASAAVQDRLSAVIRDVVARYDVDGVHFDDYFYPYPAAGMPFPDGPSYLGYMMGGGTLSVGDWRRDNVNRMVRRISTEVAAQRADARFGISPFGIYRPGMPPGITGLDPYTAIYADSRRWLVEGWVDYLAPQLYWPSTQTAQAYGPLIAWWAAQSRDGRAIFAGNNVDRLGSSSAWTLDEYRTQVRLTREQRARGALGNVWFSVSEIRDDRMGFATMLRRDLYATPALTPPMAGRRPVPRAPDVQALRGALSINPGAPGRWRAWCVYRSAAGGSYALDRCVPAAAPARVTLAAGRYAVSAVNCFGDESPGTLATVE
ncbi:MAG: family 10 glycosylhydrolase [Polyangiales bacterium]